MRAETHETKPIRFDDLALPAVYILDGCMFDVEPPRTGGGFVTFVVERTVRTERLLREYVMSTLQVDPRRCYEAFGAAKRLVHRVKERPA